MVCVTEMSRAHGSAENACWEGSVSILFPHHTTLDHARPCVTSSQHANSVLELPTQHPQRHSGVQQCFAVSGNVMTSTSPFVFPLSARSVRPCVMYVTSPHSLHDLLIRLLVHVPRCILHVGDALHDSLPRACREVSQHHLESNLCDATHMS